MFGSSSDLVGVLMSCSVSMTKKVSVILIGVFLNWRLIFFRLMMSSVGLSMYANAVDLIYPVEVMNPILIS